MPKVSLSVGEDYPHLFVSTDDDEIRWYETAEGSKHGTVVELTDKEWSDFRQAEDQYYQWMQKLDDMRKVIAPPAVPARR